jgi:TRAP-type transport system periplasmic protein
MNKALCIVSYLMIILLTDWHYGQAAQQIFKIASLAPAGSIWVEQFEKFAKEVSEKTGNNVGFRVYPGGVMGDDQSMLRKMRAGQLQGGGFTMTGIATVVPDFRILAIPFLFSSYEEVDFVESKLLAAFKQRFQEKGLELIAITEVGFIYAMSSQPINTLEQLVQSKNWSPAGDPVSETYLTSLGITPVQLSIPDVLASLQSGLIETVYNSLYGSIVLQWFTKTKYIIDAPYGYAYGAFALDGKKYAALTNAEKQIIQDAAASHFPILLKKTRESNTDSKRVMGDHGLQFISFDEQSMQILQEKREQAVKQLIPGSLSKEIYDQAMTLLNQYRQTHPEGKAN